MGNSLRYIDPDHNYYVANYDLPYYDVEYLRNIRQIEPNLMKIIHINIKAANSNFAIFPYF